MDRFDFVIVGAGAAGEAAADEARRHGASVAVVERDLYGGSCAFWACIPSKTLLHAAAVHDAGGDYPWPRASARRDYMIVREDRDYPDDSSHVRTLETSGATVVRGVGRLGGPGRVLVRTPDGGERELAAGDVILAVGSEPAVPDIEGLAEAEPWTNREGTSLRELPESIVVLGGGATGVELAQVYARYGVRTTLLQSRDRLLPRDHPRNSEAVRRGLEAVGVAVRLGVRASRVRARAGRGGEHVVELSDGSTVDGERILAAAGRRLPLADLGLETVGVRLDERGRIHPDEQLRLAEHLYVIGDPAGPELQTHVSDYEGHLAVRMALGEDVRPHLRAIPRAVFTDPEVASVGIDADEARRQGHDPLERTKELGSSARGYLVEQDGHVTAIIDRATRTLLGAFIAGPGATEAIHAAVVAMRAGLTIDVLADTITAFPTTSRVLGLLFDELARAE
ncbi:MAG TPA: NAD(P)/FAD-dependent oxidoreductase [Candidatus Limnocylindrales bacterium]